MTWFEPKRVSAKLLFLGLDGNILFRSAEGPPFWLQRPHRGVSWLLSCWAAAWRLRHSRVPGGQFHKRHYKVMGGCGGADYKHYGYHR